ncbi:MAG: hypothetical protein QNK92_05315 [Amylibacter sp.]
MDNHRFERIDKVLITLAAELDANLHRKEVEARRRSGKIGFPVLRDQHAQVGKLSQAQTKGLDDLLERMNARFETVANRIWHF